MKITLIKAALILTACCNLVLLNACGAYQSNTGTPPNSHSITQTTTTNLPSSSSQTAATTQTGACQISPAVNLSAGPAPAQGAVFFLSSFGGIQTVILRSALKRYDISTGQTTTLLDDMSTNTGIVGAQLSPDKRWLAVETQSNTTANLVKLLLIGVDGTHLQTVACESLADFVNVQRLAWSPNGQKLAYSGGGIHILNLVSGTNTTFHTTYAPLAWIDNQRLLLTGTTGNTPVSQQAQLFLLDTSLGTTQQPRQIASASPNLCSSYTLDSNAQRLYSASCTITTLNNCRSGYGFQGMGTLNVQSSTGGSAHSLYRANDLVILAIQPVGSSVLFYSQAAIGDSSLSGLWSRDSSGHMTHLLSDKSDSCINGIIEVGLPALASNGDDYALYTSGNMTNPAELIRVGRLSGGTPTTIVTSTSDLLTLVGMG